MAIACQDDLLDPGHDNGKDGEAVGLEGDLVVLRGRSVRGLRPAVQDPGRLLFSLKVDGADLLSLLLNNGFLIGDLDRYGAAGLDLHAARHDLDVKESHPRDCSDDFRFLRPLVGDDGCLHLVTVILKSFLIVVLRDLGYDQLGTLRDARVLTIGSGHDVIRSFEGQGRRGTLEENTALFLRLLGL